MKKTVSQMDRSNSKSGAESSPYDSESDEDYSQDEFNDSGEEGKSSK